MRRRAGVAVAFAALSFACGAAASPGACPSGRPAVVDRVARAMLAHAGFSGFRGSCIHSGVYWSDLWRIDCTYWADRQRSAPLRLPRARFGANGDLSQPGFYALTSPLQNGLQHWQINYMASEANGCPVPQGSPVSESVALRYGA